MDYEAELAKRAVETFVRTGAVISGPDGPPDRLRTPAGVFVSLKEHGRLRGCIGTIGPTEPTAADEIIRSAILAASEDPRFNPVTPHELNELSYSVDVLGEPEEVEGPEALDPRRYGCVVECGGRRGLLLPDLEGVDTAAEQIDICRQKGGISADEAVRLYRFTVDRRS
jgi:MEMO1 family protein